MTTDLSDPIRPDLIQDMFVVEKLKHSIKRYNRSQSSNHVIHFLKGFPLLDAWSKIASPFLDMGKHVIPSLPEKLATIGDSMRLTP